MFSQCLPMEQTINLVWSFHPVACMSPPVEVDLPFPHGNRPLPTRGVNPRPSRETGLIPLVSGPIGATNALTEITGNADENSAGLGRNPTNGVATTPGAQGKNPAHREPHSGKTRVIPAAESLGFPSREHYLSPPSLARPAQRGRSGSRPAKSDFLAIFPCVLPPHGGSEPCFGGIHSVG